MQNHELIIASGNSGKIKEIRHTLGTLIDFPFILNDISTSEISEPDEPYSTFIDNAIHKCRHYAAHTNTITLSEDTGLCIEALDNWPSIRTKDFMYQYGSIKNAIIKLEEIMHPHGNKKAFFHCAAAIYWPQKDWLITHEAQIHGQLALPQRATGGLAFDPVFIPEGYNITFAEIGEDGKHKISHRGKAVRGVVEKLIAMMKTEQQQRPQQS